MRRFIFILLILTVSGSRLSLGQDPIFTQFYAAPLYLSPSFAGGSGVSKIILNFRDQWPKLPGDYITFALSADQFLEKFNSGVGLLLLRDELAGGLITTNNIGLNYNYNFKINRKWTLTPGLQIYYHVKQIHYDELIFNDQISRDFVLPASIEIERLSSVKPIRHLDATTSLLAFNDQLWAGFTIDHLFSLNTYLRDGGGYLPIRLSVYGGGKYIISGRRRSQTQESISGAFNYMMQGDYKYLDIGAYYSRTPMLFGLWYRGLPVFADNPNNGAITLQFGYSFSNISMSYSYDYTISRLMTKTGGAHEVSVAWSTQAIKRKAKRRMIPCPSL